MATAMRPEEGSVASKCLYLCWLELADGTEMTDVDVLEVILGLL
jgi:hypothetical protein